jgi:tryptophanyl-tRNA synthetase
MSEQKKEVVLSGVRPTGPQHLGNLVGALRTAMGVCGAVNIQEMHRAEMVIAPAITTEGKSWQLCQS